MKIDNKNMGALFHEALGGGKANAAASSRDDGDLSFESRHLLCSFTLGCAAFNNICTYRFTFFQNHRA